MGAAHLSKAINSKSQPKAHKNPSKLTPITREPTHNQQSRIFPPRANTTQEQTQRSITPAQALHKIYTQSPMHQPIKSPKLKHINTKSNKTLQIPATTRPHTTLQSPTLHTTPYHAKQKIDTLTAHFT